MSYWKNFLYLIPCICVISLPALGFPDLVRHGYTTCVTCHYNPTGGGLLNSYGKFIAGELFGRYNNSETALPWLVKPEEKNDFAAGVFFRAVQTYLESKSETKGQAKIMQSDLEVGLERDHWYSFITVGVRGAAAGKNEQASDAQIRSASLSYIENTHLFRVGKFFPEYGLRTPNHNTPTGKGLYWNQGDEVYGFQWSQFNESIDYHMGLIKGGIGKTLEGHSGIVGTVHLRTPQSRSGISLIETLNDQQSRNRAQSLFTQFGFSSHGYFLGEWAWKKIISNGRNQQDRQLQFFEVGWELTKGFIPYLGYQATVDNGIRSQSSSFPIGMRFYPWTHFEVVGEMQWIHQQLSSGQDLETFFAFVMLNSYF